MLAQTLEAHGWLGGERRYLVVFADFFKGFGRTGWTVAVAYLFLMPGFSIWAYPFRAVPHAAAYTTLNQHILPAFLLLPWASPPKEEHFACQPPSPRNQREVFELSTVIIPSRRGKS